MDPRRLREETRPEHEATEALMPLGGNDVTRNLYVQTLRTLLPLVASWEQWAESAAPEDLREMVQARRRSQFLKDDLEQLTGVRPAEAEAAMPWEELVRGSAGEPERHRAAFLGAMYVMEGSTLGGRFVAKHVEAALHLTPGEGDAYFQGHGDRTGGLWKEVTTQLAALPEELDPLVVTAARRTFGIFGEALRAGVPQMETLHD